LGLESNKSFSVNIVQDYLNKAIQYHRSGNLNEAANLYNEILKLDPKQYNAMQYLGIIESQLGNAETAIQLLTKASKIMPDSAEIHSNLGNVLRTNGKLDRAIESFQRAVKLNPNIPEVHNNLGIALQARGKYDKALSHYQRALELRTNWPEVNFYIGDIYLKLKNLNEAAIYFQRAAALKPNWAEAYFELAVVLEKQGRFEEAMNNYKKALEIKPDWAEINLNIGGILAKQGKQEEALQLFQLTESLRPDWAEPYYNQGNLLLAGSTLTKAAEKYKKALKLNPEWPEAANNLGNVLLKQGKTEEAILYFLKALGFRINIEDFLTNEPDSYLFFPEKLADLLKNQVISGKQNYQGAYSNLLMAMQYYEQLTAEIYQPALKLFSDSCKDIARFKNYQNNKNPQRLKIGYISSDFRNHSCYWFFQPLLAAHNPENVETFCYYNTFNSDNKTEELKSLAHNWYDVFSLSDIELAELIRSHQIDILVDLAVHTNNNRLRVFARNPSPIQVSWLGFPASTGLNTIDYRISDNYLTPENTTEYFTEKIINTDISHCYKPPEDAPPVGPLPALKNGYLTFASFNNLSKVSPFTVKLWAGILKRSEGSKLILKANQAKDQEVMERLLKLFSENGIAENRIEFLGRQETTASHLEIYNRVDIALDTYPYNGATTTLEALYMGVPVMSLAGDRVASRYGLSFLKTLQLDNLVAFSEDEYFKKADALATDLNYLSSLRNNLREKMLKSLLCDNISFARNLESIYSQLFQNWADNG
jgi:protein O-GlcNAc transferase